MKLIKKNAGLLRSARSWGALGLVLVLAVSLYATNNVAQQAQRVGPDEAALKQGKLPDLTPPPLSKEDMASLQAARQSVMSTGCPSSFPALPNIAVSVRGANHFSSGSDVLLNYPGPITTEGGAWPASSVFIAPCLGLYYFAVDFVKDTAYNGGSFDDVSIYIAKNGVYIGYAWAGEMEPSNPYDRSTGAYHVILRMKAGEYIETFVHSDGGVKRNIFNYNFSGHRIGN